MPRTKLKARAQPGTKVAVSKASFGSEDRWRTAKVNLMEIARAPIPNKQAASLPGPPAPSARIMRAGRRCLSWLVCRLFRVKVVCPASVSEVLARGGVLVSANHVSLIDGPLVALTSPVPLVFAVDTDYSRRSPAARKGMDILARLGCGAVLPLDSTAPFGVRHLVKSLRAGMSVMVFPEGQISEGHALPEKAGFAWVIERAAPARIHVHISGAEQSRIFAKRGRHWWPRIVLEYIVDEVA